MCKVTEENVLKTIAKIGKKSAEFGGYTISLFGYHQPKEPAMLKKESK